MADSREGAAYSGDEEEPSEPGGSEGQLSPPVLLPYAPPEIAPPTEGRPAQTARILIAMSSVALLTFVVVASFVTIWLGKPIDDLTRLLEILFAPLVALVAAAVAFYYRSSL
jgi:hypothetical protein